MSVSEEQQAGWVMWERRGRGVAGRMLRGRLGDAHAGDAEEDGGARMTQEMMGLGEAGRERGERGGKRETGGESSNVEGWWRNDCSWKRKEKKSDKNNTVKVLDKEKKMTKEK